MILSIITSTPLEVFSKMIIDFYPSIHLFYVSLFQLFSMQSTFGYKLIEMKIINIDGTKVTFLKSFIRVILIALINMTGLLALVSLFCLIFTKEKKFLHDMICKTRIVRR